MLSTAIPVAAISLEERQREIKPCHLHADISWSRWRSLKRSLHEWCPCLCSALASSGLNACSSKRPLFLPTTAGQASTRHHCLHRCWRGGLAICLGNHCNHSLAAMAVLLGYLTNVNTVTKWARTQPGNFTLQVGLHVARVDKPQPLKTSSTWLPLLTLLALRPRVLR